MRFLQIFLSYGGILVLSVTFVGVLLISSGCSDAETPDNSVKKSPDYNIDYRFNPHRDWTEQSRGLPELPYELNPVGLNGKSIVSREVRAQDRTEPDILKRGEAYPLFFTTQQALLASDESCGPPELRSLPEPPSGIGYGGAYGFILFKPDFPRIDDLLEQFDSLEDVSDSEKVSGLISEYGLREGEKLIYNYPTVVEYFGIDKFNINTRLRTHTILSPNADGIFFCGDLKFKNIPCSGFVQLNGFSFISTIPAVNYKYRYCIISGLRGLLVEWYTAEYKKTLE